MNVLAISSSVCIGMCKYVHIYIYVYMVCVVIYIYTDVSWLICGTIRFLILWGYSDSTNVMV